MRSAFATACSCLLLSVSTPATARFDATLYEPYEGRVVSGVNLTGNQITKPYVILREIRTVTGDTLCVQTLKEDYIRLENLSIFASVSISVTAFGDSVAVGFEVREMPWIIPLIKFRYTEQDGWSLGPALTSVNMLGYGVSLSASALFGGATQGVIESQGPWFTSNRYRYDLRFAHLNRDDTLNEFREKSSELTPWIRHHVSDRVSVGASIGYFEMSADRDSVTLQPDRRDQFGNVGASVMYDSRDSWRNTQAGLWAEILVDRYFNDGDWWHTDVDLRGWTEVSRKHSLAVGGLTSFQTGTVGAEFPGYLMYRMGGANSIRGYDIEKLGRMMYGQNQVILTTEYQFLLVPIREWPVLKWAFSAGFAVATFIDVGTAWNNHQALAWENSRTGFGIGLRCLVPGINVIRLDVAFSEHGDVRFHFATWDKFTAQRARLR